MKTRRRQYVSDDSLTVSRRNSRASTSTTNAKEEQSETISTDLVFEILLRLPGKSIARSRCVSKLWNSTLRCPYFTELFLTMSLTRPRLLFSFRKDHELCFFSAPQGESSSSPVSADFHLKLKLDDSYQVCGHVRGLVCLADLREIKGRRGTAPVICNPSTGQFLTLPKVKTKRRVAVTSFFGFDPTDQEFKVLTITDGVEHRVLTLGTQKLEWRMIEGDIPDHWPYSHGNGICISGRVYYDTWVSRSVRAIVCFHVRLEKFSVINAAEDMDLCYGILVNYKGKLGVRIGTLRRFEVWVLVDAETHEWSKHVSVLLPPLWKNVSFAGVAGGSDEVVLWPCSIDAPFYVYYYNMERNTFRRVEIKGMDASVGYYGGCMTLDYVEDVKLMKYV